jgi:hypothetical protein
MLGVRLPGTLRTLYGLLGKRFDLTRCQDDLLTPYQCHWDDADEVLVFRTENQGCADWGIRRADLSAEDPPVVFNAGRGWQPFLPSTSLACVEMLLSEGVFGGEWTGWLYVRGQTAEDLHELCATIPGDWQVQNA